MLRRISLIIFIGSFLLTTPTLAKIRCTKSIIALGVASALIGIGVPGAHHLFMAGGSPTLVQMPTVALNSVGEPLELFSRSEREYFFSVKKLYPSIPQDKFFNKNRMQKWVSQKINEKLIFYTPQPWKKNIIQEDAINVAVEGLLLRKHGSKVEALLVTPIGQYWFPQKIDIAELNSGTEINIEAIEMQEHAIADGENKMMLSFSYDKDSRTVLMKEISMQLKLKLVGGFIQKDSIFFKDVRAGHCTEYTQRPEYGAFELDDDQ